MYNLAALAGPLVVPPMKHFLASWDPTRDPRGPAQVKLRVVHLGRSTCHAISGRISVWGETLHPETWNPETYRLNPNPGSRTPGPKTPNPKPGTQNPNP